MINTRKPIAGVEYFEGAGSAAKSIIAKFGEIPPHLRYDMGIVDINVYRTSNIRKPRIEFSSDKTQGVKHTRIVRKSVNKQKFNNSATMKSSVGIKGTRKSPMDSMLFM